MSRTERRTPSFDEDRKPRHHPRTRHARAQRVSLTKHLEGMGTPLVDVLDFSAMEADRTERLRHA